MNPMRITQHDFESFTGNLLATTDSKATRKALKSDLGTFWGFTRGNLSEPHLRLYKNFLVDADYAPRSVARLLSSARRFIELLVYERLIERNIFDHIKGPKIDRYDSPYVALTDSEVRLLLATPDRSTLIGAGKRLSLVLGFFLGLRVSEMVSLKMSSIVKTNQGSTIKIRGKGNKVRSIPLDDMVLEEIEAYVATSLLFTDAYEESDYILRTRKSGEGMVHTTTIETWYSEVAEAAGVTTKLTPHSARATVITKALENDASIRDVAAFAGHISVETTSIYDKRRGMASANTVAKIRY